MANEPDLDLMIATGEDAKRLQHNPLWRNILKAMHGHIDSRQLECPGWNKDLAADIVRCKQLMTGIEREVTRLIQEGEAARVAQVKLQEIQKTPKERIFRR